MQDRAIYVWERHDSRPHLDGYINWTTYAPRPYGTTSFTIIETIPFPNDWEGQNAATVQANTLVKDLVAAREARVLNALLGETEEN